MPRAQFTLRSLLVAMLVVAAFFAGVAYNRADVNRMRDLVRRREEAADKSARQLHDVVVQLANLKRQLQASESKVERVKKHGIDKSELAEAIGGIGTEPETQE